MGFGAIREGEARVDRRLLGRVRAVWRLSVTWAHVRVVLLRVRCMAPAICMMFDRYDLTSSPF